MTTDPEAQHVLPSPDVIPAKVSIEHLQLRDLLQASSSEGKCLIINRLLIEEVDFNQPDKGPTHFETLTFRPNCLSAGNGLVAAGGQQSELFVCPLPDPHNSTISSLASTRPWKISTTTGGSINNAIAIEPDGSDDSFAAGSLIGDVQKLERFDVSRRSGRPPRSSERRPTILDEGEAAELEIEAEGWAAARGFSYREGSADVTPRHAGNTRKTFDGRSDEEDQWQEQRKKGKTKVGCRSNKASPTVTPTCNTPSPQLQLFVSNNDRSLKIYQLHSQTNLNDTDVPSRRDFNVAQSGPSASTSSPRPASVERVETLDFPTAINHSSLSPDGSTLVVVGDTPQVFIYQRESIHGSFKHIATYRASSEASFSTSWHPDGSKFAVASQDGHVSVWDVRSNKKLAELKSTQSIGIPSGAESLSTLNGVAGAVRAVKFSPCGRYLAFTEHRKVFHIYDAETFQHGQTITVPTTCHRAASHRSGERSSPSHAIQASDLSPAFLPDLRERSRRISQWGSLDRASLAAEDGHSRGAGGGAVWDSNLSVLARRSFTNLRSSLFDEDPTTTSNRNPDQTGRASPGERNRTNSSGSGYRSFNYRSSWREARDLPDDVSRLQTHDTDLGQDREDRSLSPGDVQQAASSNSTNSTASDDTLEHSAAVLERMREQYRSMDADVTNEISAIRNANLDTDLDDEYERAVSAYISPSLRAPWTSTRSNIQGGGASGEDNHYPTLRAYTALMNRGPQFGAYTPGSISHGVSMGTGSNATALRLGRLAAAAAANAAAAASSSSPSNGQRNESRAGFFPYGDHTAYQHPTMGDAIVNIAGLCWDPNSKYIYVATERMVCRYEVKAKTRMYGKAEIR